MARSATSSVRMSGVLLTGMPRSRAAARSTESVPTPNTEITSSLGNAAIKARSAPRLASVAMPLMRPLSSALSASGAGRLKWRSTAKRFASSVFVASGNAPMLRTSIFMRASNLEHLLRGLVQAFARPIRPDQIVVADHCEDRRAFIGWMDGEIHVCFDIHRLVGADQRPLDEIVALAVRVEAKLRREAVVAHVVVVLGGNLSRRCSGLEQTQRVRLRLLHRFEAVDELVRRLAQNDGARDLGVHASRTVVFDQHREVLAGSELPSLKVVVDKARRLSERRRRAEKNPLHAAAQAALVLGQCGEIITAHARLDLLEHARKDRILHFSTFADELLFLLALDGFEMVDEFGRIDECRLARNLVLDARDEFMRHRAAADPADGAIPAMPELGGDDLGLILVSVGDRREGRREQLLAHAAISFVTAVELATHALSAHVDRDHQV